MMTLELNHIRTCKTQRKLLYARYKSEMTLLHRDEGQPEQQRGKMRVGDDDEESMMMVRRSGSVVREGNEDMAMTMRDANWVRS
mgnify:CR=1 FL=1